ncbi:ribonuclease H-like domain-containing protein [Tanacetum coccineum]
MCVHNSVHNSLVNSDRDDDVQDSDTDTVTRISKLDISDPLHLYHNDTTALTVVSIKLKGTENYQISTLKHNGSSIADYYHKLNALWKQYDAMIELPKCVCNGFESFKKHNQLLKLLQFLIGLDDSYMQIRSSILSRKVLPNVRSAYATISSEESHKVAAGSIAGSSQRNQASAFVSNVPKRNNFQRNRTSGFTQRNQVFGSSQNQKKSNKTFKRKNISNNNSVGSSSSSGFTDEQMATLISLIKDNKVGKNMQANMAHNVIDISHLRIKVGHPNGTEAYISKIWNIRLSNGLTLFDVMVIPEYCVTLIFVHKLAKENKHAWHYRLGHLAEPVLNVLKDYLQIDKKDNIGCCEIYQRAKQTREHFPLSDHTSKSLGDLVHLDLWGPYKVTSYEGFRYFLTVVDDYTRAVWVYLIKSKDEDSEVEKNDSANVFQDVNHINFFDIEYPEIPNDDDRVANGLNKDKSDSSSSSVFGSNINTADFPIDYGNDADNSDESVATQNEEVATLEKNVFFSEGILDQNPSSSQGVQNVRRSSRQSVFRKNYNDFVVESKVKYELPEGRKAIGSKWIYKIRFKSSGEIDRYNARLVSQGFSKKKEGIDYEETFSHVVKMEVVYMKPPEGYFPSNNKVWRLKNSLYGLKQAPRQWNAKLTSTSIENGFSQSKSDYSLYTKSDKGVFLSLVYVDDIIITGNSISEIEKFKVFLKSKFMIKDLGKLKYFHGIEVVDTDKASVKDPLLENITDYQKLMGKLIYLTNTRLDISYVVHCLSQFMHSYLTSHLKIAFKILRYLKSCPGLGIHITKTFGMFLNAYSDDADWAKCIVTRKSVTVYCVFLNNPLVSWKSKKQNTLSKSSTEAEYRALASVTSEVIWILKILKDL